MLLTWILFGISMSLRAIPANKAATVDYSGVSLARNQIETLATCPTGHLQLSSDSTFKNCEVSDITAPNAAVLFQLSNKLVLTLKKSKFMRIRGSYGAVIGMTTESTVDMEDCEIIDCSGSSTQYKGGAVYFGFGYFYNRNNLFKDCSHAGIGGAFYINSVTEATFDDCKFINCSAAGGAGIGCYYSAKIFTVTNCTFDDCRSIGDNGNGGGVYMEWGGCRLDKCVITKCSSANGGAGLHGLYGNTTLWNCEFSDCVSYVKNNTGVYYGGCVSATGGPFAAYRCTFTNCQCEEHGGALFFGSLTVNANNYTTTVHKCTITKCSAGGEGAAIYFSRETHTLVLDGIVCYDCSAIEDGMGRMIYIDAVAAFTWSNLCITGTGSVFYSVVNQPPADKLTEDCTIIVATPTSKFTGYHMHAHEVTIFRLELFVYVTLNSNL